ncbi:MAG: L,D-transpeptidase [Candidatus Eisenbacteria bacterium]|nr:L,D-transpeptidase [Candidatus Eisenbacteria bacterium]
MRRPAAVALLVSLAVAGCGRAQAPGPPAGSRIPSATDSAAGAAAPPVAPAPETTTVRYDTFPITDPHALLEFERKHGAEGFLAVLKVNRIDLAHARQGDTLVVPERLDMPALSPFPAGIPAARGLAKLLLVSARVQAFAAYDTGRLVRWGPTSTGRREKPTPPGLYRTNWKDRERVSTFNEEWLLEWYVNLENREGISLHQYDLPGRPASHSCVRLLADDAEWLYGWADTWALTPDGRGVVKEGTPVVVMGAYAFGQRRPWQRLPDDPRATAVTAAEVDSALALAIPPRVASADSLAAAAVHDPLPRGAPAH